MATDLHVKVFLLGLNALTDRDGGGREEKTMRHLQRHQSGLVGPPADC